MISKLKNFNRKKTFCILFITQQKTKTIKNSTTKFNQNQSKELYPWWNGKAQSGRGIN